MLRVKLWVCLAMYAWTACAVWPGQSALAQQAGADAIQADVAILKDSAASADQQTDAARRLVHYHSAESRAAILDLLNARPAAPRVALAKALAEDPDSDPDFIDPLFVMMTEQDRPDEAARALGSYKKNAQLLSRLLDFSSNPRNGKQRIYAIKALGYMVDRQAAERLVALLGDEDPGVSNEAWQALEEMTGLNYGSDFQRWQEWWAANRAKSADQFRLDLLFAKANQLDAAQNRTSSLQTNYGDFLDSEYQSTPPQAQPAKLMSYLTAENDPVMRRVAAEIVDRAKLDGRPVPPAALTQLRLMIGDVDPGVRQAVVVALKDMNDRDSLDPLLKQLNEEDNPTVRASIAAAFGPIGDLKAVKPLLNLLDDRPPVAAAAAESLSYLTASLHTADPALAAEAAKRLKVALDRTGDPATQSLRESIVHAMAELKDPSLAPTFRGVLKPAESVLVRQYALEGLGNLGDANNEAIIAQSLNDPDPGVRAAAVTALKDVNAYIHAPQLVAMCKPDADKPQVQNRAWEALETFMPELNEQQLSNFADAFKQNGQWDKRLVCLQQLAADFQKRGDDGDWADTQEDIGECQMQLKNYPEAAAAYAAAMSVKERTEPADGVVMSRLITARMKALLRVGKFPEAMQFAQQSMQKDPSKIEEMGNLINQEADRLRSEGAQNPAQLDNALQLIDLAMKLNPSLQPRYQDMLQQTKSEIQSMQAKKHSGNDPYPYSDGATARAVE